MTTQDLTAANFEATVTEHDIALVDFWAAWCGPCRQFAPVYDAAAAANPDIVFGKVDTEAEQQLAAAANGRPAIRRDRLRHPGRPRGSGVRHPH